MPVSSFSSSLPLRDLSAVFLPTARGGQLDGGAFLLRRRRPLFPFSLSSPFGLLSLRNNVLNKATMPRRWAGCLHRVTANGVNAAFQFLALETQDADFHSEQINALLQIERSFSALGVVRAESEG